MSQPQPPNQPPQNPFSDQPQSPFGPGGPYPNPYPQPTRLEDDPAMRWVLPMGHSVWAIIAGYFGLFSFVCFPAPLALLFSIIAIVHLRKNPRMSGWGRAIFGLVMGVLGSIGLTFMLIGMIAGNAGR